MSRHDGEVRRTTPATVARDPRLGSGQSNGPAVTVAVLAIAAKRGRGGPRAGRHLHRHRHRRRREPARLPDAPARRSARARHCAPAILAANAQADEDSSASRRHLRAHVRRARPVRRRDDQRRRRPLDDRSTATATSASSRSLGRGRRWSAMTIADGTSTGAGGNIARRGRREPRMLSPASPPAPRTRAPGS